MAYQQSFIISYMNERCGEIIIKDGTQVWDHELRTGKALSAAGYSITFLPKNNASCESSPDILLNGLVWEMKSPLSDQAKRIQRTLRRALHQSENIIFDSQRIKKLSDAQVLRELRKWVPQMNHLKHLIYVDKRRNVTVIK